MIRRFEINPLGGMDIPSDVQFRTGSPAPVPVQTERAFPIVESVTHRRIGLVATSTEQRPETGIVTTISTLHVDTPYRNQGAEAAALLFVEAQAAKLRATAIEITTFTGPASAIYSRYGFQLLSTPDPDSRIVRMRKPLK